MAEHRACPLVDHQKQDVGAFVAGWRVHGFVSCYCIADARQPDVQHVVMQRSLGKPLLAWNGYAWHISYALSVMS
jgi:hypothetical protein